MHTYTYITQILRSSALVKENKLKLDDLSHMPLTPAITHTLWCYLNANVTQIPTNFNDYVPYIAYYLIDAKKLVLYYKLFGNPTLHSMLYSHRIINPFDTFTAYDKPPEFQMEAAAAHGDMRVFKYFFSKYSRKPKGKRVREGIRLPQQTVNRLFAVAAKYGHHGILTYLFHCSHSYTSLPPEINGEKCIDAIIESQTAPHYYNNAAIAVLNNAILQRQTAAVKYILDKHVHVLIPEQAFRAVEVDAHELLHYFLTVKNLIMFDYDSLLAAAIRSNSMECVKYILANTPATTHANTCDNARTITMLRFLHEQLGCMIDQSNYFSVIRSYTSEEEKLQMFTYLYSRDVPHFDDTRIMELAVKLNLYTIAKFGAEKGFAYEYDDVYKIFRDGPPDIRAYFIRKHPVIFARYRILNLICAYTDSPFYVAHILFTIEAGLKTLTLTLPLTLSMLNYFTDYVYPSAATGFFIAYTINRLCAADNKYSSYKINTPLTPPSLQEGRMCTGEKCSCNF